MTADLATAPPDDDTVLDPATDPGTPHLWGEWDRHGDTWTPTVATTDTP